MHGSIWRFAGDPDDLAARYDAMLLDVGPETLEAHICLRTTDGLIVVDTCPTREAFEGWVAGPLPGLLAKHGLPEPTIEDHPVHYATTRSERQAQAAV